MNAERVIRTDPAEWAISVAHDFKNLLFVITGHCQLLAQTMDDDDPRGVDLQAIMAASDRAVALTRELMAVGRGISTPDRRLDPNALVRGLVPLLRHLVGDGIRLDVRLAPGVSPVRINVTQLEQVVMNLVINARDAMSSQGVLTIATENRGDDWVVLSVVDTGTGLTKEAQGRMFDPGYTTKSEKGGTGIGLATSRAVVTANGGTMEVESAVGVGTAMRVVLPSANALAQAAAAEAETSGAGARERILLVDDEPAIRYLLANCLRVEGYQVMLASTGKEALDTYLNAGESIDLMVADINLPDMRGFDVASQLRTQRPDLGLVFISGVADPNDDSARAFEAPLLTKPFSMVDLRRVLRETLDARIAA
jgi:two-component system cell cycle sensor histidine kinase/response regulator CckA